MNTWAQQHKQVIDWIESSHSNFAASLRFQLDNKGSLTENQTNKVIEIINKQKADLDTKLKSAATVNTGDLMAAFKTAQANLVKRPRIHIDSVVVKLAPQNGANPGALYVTDDDQYNGKIVSNRFLKTPHCSPETEAKVLALLADPLGNMVAYGKRTGMCCICSRELTNEGSIADGIGPICAGKFGF